MHICIYTCMYILHMYRTEPMHLIILRDQVVIQKLTINRATVHGKTSNYSKF